MLANPAVSVALSGMNTLAMIDENVASASRQEPLSAAELAGVDAMMARLQALSDLYCTGCGYCLPCPNGVDIPTNFVLMNQARVYGMVGYAREQYASWLKGEEPWVLGADVRGLPADHCIQCGQCEPKCPQHLPIIEQLQETHAALS